MLRTKIRLNSEPQNDEYRSKKLEHMLQSIAEHKNFTAETAEVAEKNMLNSEKHKKFLQRRKEREEKA
ncbi:MAG: hypothetical protein MAGBODY4_00637 [Candidatus Marinimicrobia bacterium]|nr:hypothetical protein [Candidatus Neomarinimicrobiota bacterium]